MSFKIAGGAKEKGIIVGNVFNKYGSRNPIVKLMMNGFKSELESLVTKTSPLTIHEVGCGEGHWVLWWNRQGRLARGSDFSNRVIEIARSNAISQGFAPTLFDVRNIYDLQPETDSADLVVCCETLEHVARPSEALRSLQGVVHQYLIVSVPREPMWRILNLARGKYFARLGNTPGHIQHWSKRSFIRFIQEYFEVVDMRLPLPWIMLLCRPRS